MAVTIAAALGVLLVCWPTPANAQGSEGTRPELLAPGTTTAPGGDDTGAEADGGAAPGGDESTDATISEDAPVTTPTSTSAKVRWAVAALVAIAVVVAVLTVLYWRATKPVARAPESPRRSLQGLIDLDELLEQPKARRR